MMFSSMGGLDMNEKLKKALALYWYFFRMGWYTFGGGWSIVAQIEKDFADTRREMTAEELLDMVSVGRSLPRLMVGNIAYLFGCHQGGGTLGGVFSVLGIAAALLLGAIGKRSTLGLA